MRVCYVTRERVQAVLRSANLLRLNSRIDDAIQVASGQVEGDLHRKFYPTLDTREFDLPQTRSLWLYEHELAAAPTTIVSGDTTMTTADYILFPQSGPPYRWIDVNTSGSVSWESGDTPQRCIAITGSFGGSADELLSTTLSTTINSSTTVVDIADSSAVGIGDLIKLDSERMIVRDRSFITTTATLSADIAASKSVVSLTVSNGALITAGEYILIDSERMFVETISGNTVTVSRAEQGSALAAHTSTAVVLAPRRLAVQRAQAGTTAASHDAPASIYRNVAPPLVTEYALALTLNYLQQGSNAYTRQPGAGENSQAAAGSDLRTAYEAAYTAHGAKWRSRAVM